MKGIFGDGKRKKAKQETDTVKQGQVSSSRYMPAPTTTTKTPIARPKAPTTSLTGEPLSPTRRKKVSGIVSHKRGGSANPLKKLYGGRNKVSRAKSGSDCFKGGKGCGPNK